MSYDYIILGGGSAGCVLANRLSADPACNVLLVEAGSARRSLFVSMPTANGFIFGNKNFDWSFRTTPQDGMNGRRVHWPRGRRLGGTSTINGMIYIRGNAADYDGWRQQGLDGWSYAEVLPYFKRLEDSHHGGSEYHGTGGPLKTGGAGGAAPIDLAFLEAAQQAGMEYNHDFNGARQQGVGLYDVSVSKGKRSDTASAYIRPIKDRSNLTVMSSTYAQKLEMEGRRVTGVTVTRKGRTQAIKAAKEVISCLGALNSPQLLMVSGIGPEQELTKHGIDVKHDLPGVGENLQDHLGLAVQYETLDAKATFDRFQRFDRAMLLGLRYLLTKTGPGAHPFWSAGAFHSSSPDVAPEVQFFFTPMLVIEDPDNHRKLAKAGYQIDINQMRPDSRGRITLASEKMSDAPLMDPRYLTEEKDRREMIDAVRAARDIGAQSAFDKYRGAEVSPGADRTSDEAILEYIKDNAISGYHPVGTCKMATDTDPMAVVDAQLRVHGIEGLRVVDASIMPTIVTGNTNAPTIMIAEKAADMIVGKTPLSRADV